jgi:hypothetical protein
VEQILKDMNSLDIKIELNNCFKIEKMPIIKIEKTCLFVFVLSSKQDYIPFVYVFLVMIIFLLYLYFLLC